LLGGALLPMVQGVSPLSKIRCTMHETETSPALNPDQKTAFFQPGTLVRVTQQIPHRLDTCTSTVSGKVIRQERHSSGSWFAGNKDDRVWLDRLVIEKTDGEITILNLDEYSVIEVLEGAPAAVAESPLVEPAERPDSGIT
jgi:hypothetical protein